MGKYLDLSDVAADHPVAEAELQALRAVEAAARNINHWHDREPDGMVVSAEHVRALWSALRALDECEMVRK